MDHSPEDKRMQMEYVAKGRWDCPGDVTYAWKEKGRVHYSVSGYSIILVHVQSNGFSSHIFLH